MRLNDWWIWGCAAKAARGRLKPVRLGIPARFVQIERQDGCKIRTTIPIDSSLD